MAIVAVLLNRQGVVCRWPLNAEVSRLYKSRDADPISRVFEDPNGEPQRAIKPREFRLVGIEGGEHVYLEHEDA